MKKLAAIWLCFLITGCATPVQHNTPSGKAEITINNVKKDKVKDAIISDAVNNGYMPYQSNDMILSFDRPVEDAMMQAFLGSRYDRTPNTRISFTLVQNSNSVRVISDLVIITNPHSAFERRTDMNNSEQSVVMQSWLNNLKKKLEHKR